MEPYSIKNPTSEAPKIVVTPLPSQKPPVHEGRCFLAWLVFAIVSTLASVVIGWIFGFILGTVMGSAGVDIDVIQSVGAIVGALLGFACSFLAFRFIAVRMIRDWVLAPR